MQSHSEQQSCPHSPKMADAAFWSEQVLACIDAEPSSPNITSTVDCHFFVVHTGYERALLRMLNEKSVEENFSVVDDVRGLLTRIGCICVYYKGHQPYYLSGEGIDAKLTIQLSGYPSESGLVFTKIHQATGNISDINDIGFCRLYNTINKVSIVGGVTVFDYDAEAESYHKIMRYENEED